MNKQLLILITSDPRQSPKPAEAVRIGAGISAGGGVKVSICFCGDSVLAVGESSDELIDGGNFSRYLPLILETGGEVLALENPPRLRESVMAPIRVEVIGLEQLACRTADCGSVLRF